MAGTDKNVEATPIGTDPGENRDTTEETRKHLRRKTILGYIVARTRKDAVDMWQIINYRKRRPPHPEKIEESTPGKRRKEQKTNQCSLTARAGIPILVANRKTERSKIGRKETRCNLGSYQSLNGVMEGPPPGKTMHMFFRPKSMGDMRARLERMALSLRGFSRNAKLLGLA